MSTFRRNLARARSHIVFIVALLAGLALVLYLEGLLRNPFVRPPPESPLSLIESVPMPLSVPGPATKPQLEQARIAWKYFQNNINPDTGLANSANNYPSTTMWETGSFLIALISAHRLALIDDAEVEARLSQALDSLAKLPLFEGSLPNKAYDVRSLAMVNYLNEPTAVGLGWSALDMARLLSSLEAVERNYPDQAARVDNVVSRWELSRLVSEGRLNGASVVEGLTVENQEGRVGYEQYAGKVLMMYGLDALHALRTEDNLTVRDVEGVNVPADTRLNRNQVPAFITSEPFLFDGLEFGFDQTSHRLASAVYRAQEMRYRSTGILTAVTEGHITVAPYFAYSTVWGGGAPWAVLTLAGDRLDSRRTLSTKAAFGWDALFDTEYTDELVEGVAELADPELGWAEGIYEASGEMNTSRTANTNAVVLAALAFRSHGPLLGVGR
ncbi:DUF3131 domain-containing protein [Falsirhodobacter sp. 20TX0035]|uniref:DUF3131 domain-containing protein n=1 Tax=Falsirhodobacter sp. 20TX0035 TaxID=3022019 RepID=UPI00232B2E7D|nr:DUF3131 domain-containing protein [Falsirhodobacter sp. 20TX0035]MDB6454762.1 DUF3131 domain-containing protein [Falsirhodobacter sp. 20TX0035]